MEHFTLDKISQLEKFYRANLINSITGIKPANLIGTEDAHGNTNLAIFTSVVHLGSNPPLLGIIFRPVGDVPRHTYNNIKTSLHYTLNAVPAGKTREAHYTSAKFDDTESEFKECGFTTRYLDGFKAPFVKESPLQIGLKFKQEIPIELNNTILVIGEVQHISVEGKALSQEGYIDFEQLKVAGVSGLNSYYGLEKKADYPYAKKEEWQK